MVLFVNQKIHFFPIWAILRHIFAFGRPSTSPFIGVPRIPSSGGEGAKVQDKIDYFCNGEISISHLHGRQSPPLPLPLCTLLSLFGHHDLLNKIDEDEDNAQTEISSAKQVPRSSSPLLSLNNPIKGIVLALCLWSSGLVFKSKLGVFGNDKLV